MGVRFSKRFTFWNIKCHMGHDLGITERVRALVFILWLKTGGFFGTILAHTFFMFQFVVKIRLTVSLSIFSSSAVFLMPNRRSVLTRVLTLSTFSSVFIAHLPHPLFLLKTSCDIQTHNLLIRCFLHTPHVTN